MQHLIGRCVILDTMLCCFALGESPLQGKEESVYSPPILFTVDLAEPNRPGRAGRAAQAGLAISEGSPCHDKRMLGFMNSRKYLWNSIGFFTLILWGFFPACGGDTVGLEARLEESTADASLALEKNLQEPRVTTETISDAPDGVSNEVPTEDDTPETYSSEVYSDTTSPDSSGTQLYWQKAADYSQKRCGLTMLAMRYGKITYEAYHNGHTQDLPIHLNSATKQFWAVATAAMIQDGLLTSWDEVVAETLTEWKDSTKHPGKNRILLSHLLTLTSGLSQDVEWIQGSTPKAQNLYDYAVNNLRLVSAPGQRFQYGPSHYYAFGAMVQRKLASRKQNPLDYLKSRIFDPIGVKVGMWLFDKSKNPHIPNGAYLTAREWIKFGQFLLQKGQWNGKTIIEARLMERLAEPGPINPGHGFFLWLNRVGGMDSAGRKAPPGSTAGFIYHNSYPNMNGAMGAGKCRMYMFPSLQLVVLRQAATQSDNYVDHQFLQALLEGKVEQPSSPPVRCIPKGDPPVQP